MMLNALCCALLLGITMVAAVASPKAGNQLQCCSCSHFAVPKTAAKSVNEPLTDPHQSWVVRLKNGTNADLIARKYGFENFGTIRKTSAYLFRLFDYKMTSDNHIQLQSTYVKELCTYSSR